MVCRENNVSLTYPTKYRSEEWRKRPTATLNSEYCHCEQQYTKMLHAVNKDVKHHHWYLGRESFDGLVDFVNRWECQPRTTQGSSHVVDKFKVRGHCWLRQTSNMVGALLSTGRLDVLYEERHYRLAKWISYLMCIRWSTMMQDVLHISLRYHGFTLEPPREIPHATIKQVHLHIYLFQQCGWMVTYPSILHEQSSVKGTIATDHGPNSHVFLATINAPPPLCCWVSGNYK